jgi:CRISPR-associated protein Cmr4
MYTKAYGTIETFAPLHVGATAGEETGNLNLIFRDQFTQTGIVPGSSIRGRLRSEMRMAREQWLEQEIEKKEVQIPENYEWSNEEDQKEFLTKLRWLERKAKELKITPPVETNENFWYGYEAESELSENTTESVVKFEYASLLWLPVFCPGQPIVWVSCPKLLKRYKRIAGIQQDVPKPYTRSKTLNPLKIKGKEKLFFNFGWIALEEPKEEPKKIGADWFPNGEELPSVVVGDDEIGMIHDMALYRQSRVALEAEQKRVKGKAFFNTEALPEGTILVFPIAIKELKQNQSDKSKQSWQPFGDNKTVEIYLGGLESIGFGHCKIIFKITSKGV